MLNAPITIQEFQLAVATSLNNKAPVSDGPHVDVQEIWTELLTFVLNLKHRVPPHYYESTIKTKEKQCTAYRPMSLLYTDFTNITSVLAIQEMHFNLQLSTDNLGNCVIFSLDDAKAFNSVE